MSQPLSHNCLKFLPNPNLSEIWFPLGCCLVCHKFLCKYVWESCNERQILYFFFSHFILLGIYLLKFCMLCLPFTIHFIKTNLLSLSLKYLWMWLWIPFSFPSIARIRICIILESSRLHQAMWFQHDFGNQYSCPQSTIQLADPLSISVSIPYLEYLLFCYF